MGAAHSQAWRTAGHVAELPLRPEMALLAGRRRDSAAAAADRLGWQDSTDDWRAAIARD
jgi:predicted dehydrogenase